MQESILKEEVLGESFSYENIIRPVKLWTPGKSII